MAAQRSKIEEAKEEGQLELKALEQEHADSMAKLLKENTTLTKKLNEGKKANDAAELDL